MATQTRTDDTPTAEPVSAAPEPVHTDDSPVVLRYTGDGDTFYRGVPRRDLTKAEAEAIRERRPVIYTAMTTPAEGQDTPLYERVKGGK